MDQPLFRIDFWTNGAQRALGRAAQLATYIEAPEVSPLHLLWALLNDEGRAGLSLEEAGITTTIFDPNFPGIAQVDLEDLRSITPTAGWGSQAESVVRESRHLSFQAHASSETGTDYLLLALLRHGGEASELLRGHNLVEDWQPVPSVPLPPDPLPTSSEPEQLPEELRLNVRERAEPSLPDLYRILDAAANRAREGLRVLEDFSRFVLNDRHLSQLLKTIRHDLAEALSMLPQSALIASRDTVGDVGTAIEARNEYHRLDLRDVVVAAGKRAQEAFRTLEEYCKVVSGDLSRHFERLRYLLYTVEKGLLTADQSRERLQDQRLYLLLTEEASPSGLLLVLKTALEAGIKMFQVREKTWPDRRLLEHCRLLRRWTREREALLIINDRPDLAVLCDADGVHVGQDELSVADARRIVGHTRLVGVSTHTIEQARQAVLDGADYLGVGPTFPSQTKAFEAFAGLEFVRQVADEISLPWFAIGGINDENLASVLEQGARRVAVTRAISAAGSPLEVTSSLMSTLRHYATAPDVTPH